MSGVTKFSISLLISIVVFSVLAVLVAVDRFQFLETRFYAPRVEQSIEGRARRAAEVVDEFHERSIGWFREFTLAPSVTATFRINASEEVLLARQQALDALELELSSLDQVRIIDLTGDQLQYSSDPADFRSSAGQREYLRPDAVSERLSTPLSELAEYESFGEDDVLPSGEQLPPPEIVLDETSNQFIYRLPAVDGNGLLQGTALFYVNTRDLGTRLVRNAVIGTMDEVRLIADTGIAVNVPVQFSESITAALVDSWNRITSDDERVSVSSSTEREGSSFDYQVFEAATERDGLVLYLEPSRSLQMPNALQYTLVGAIFLTTFLIVFLILNVRQDAVVVLEDRVKRFHVNFLREFMAGKDEMDFDRWRAELEDRREEVNKEIRRGIGKIPKEQEAHVDGLIDRTWDEIIGVLSGRAQEASGRTLGEDEIERIIAGVAQVMKTTPLTVNAARVVGAPEDAGGPGSRESTPGTPEAVEELEDVDDLEDVESADEIETIEEADDVDALDDTETLEDSDVRTPLTEEEIARRRAEYQRTKSGQSESPADNEAPAAEIESIEDGDEPEPAESIDEIEEIEEIDEVDAVDEMEETDEVDDVEEVDEIDEVDEADEAEEIEEIDDVDAVDEIEETDAVDEIEEVDKVSPAEMGELGEIEEDEAIAELDSAEVLGLDDEEEAAVEAPGSTDSAHASEAPPDFGDVSFDTLDERAELEWLASGSVPEFAPSAAQPPPSAHISPPAEENSETRTKGSDDVELAEAADADLEEVAELEPAEDEELEPVDGEALPDADVEPADGEDADLVELETDVEDLESGEDEIDADLVELEVEELEPIKSDGRSAAGEEVFEELQPVQDESEPTTPEELPSQRVAATTFGAGLFGFGRGTAVALSGGGWGAGRHGSSIGEGLNEAPPEGHDDLPSQPPPDNLDVSSDTEEATEVEELDDRDRDPHDSTGLVRISHDRSVVTPDYEIATLSELLNRLHVSRSILQEQDGVVQIDREAYGATAAGSDASVKNLVAEVTGMADVRSITGIEELFGGSEDDLFSDFGSDDEEEESPTSDAGVSVFRFNDSGFDYDSFLAGFRADDIGRLKSLVRFTRYWGARVGVVLEEGELEYKPLLSIGVEGECRDRFRISKSSEVSRNVLAKGRVLFISRPLREVEYFHDLCSVQHLSPFERTLFVPIILDGKPAYFCMGLEEKTTSLDAAFKSILPLIKQRAVPIGQH